MPERLGQLISYVRFLYIRMHRDWFRDELLAELLPPLEPDGTSHLWDALGRKFTEMTYAEADRLSKKNKEFIKGLFPEGAIYASLLPQEAQDVIGKVGAQTRGSRRCSGASASGTHGASTRSTAGRTSPRRRTRCCSFNARTRSG